MAKPYDPKDFYFRQAKKAGLRARSAFKIEEILHRHRLLARGDAVLDLGAAPGGFLQILAEAVGEKGVAIGVDLEPIRNLGKPWVRTDIVDLLAPDALERIRALHPGRFRLVTSDMAPKTIGIKVTDEARSLELVRMALAVAERTLAPRGAFVAKVFMGGDFPELRRELQQRFESFHIVRPEATRESSYEVYVLGKGFRGSQHASPPNPDANPPPVPEPRGPGSVAPGQLQLPLPGAPVAPSARPPPLAQAGGEGGLEVKATARRTKETTSKPRARPSTPAPLRGAYAQGDREERPATKKAPAGKKARAAKKPVAATKKAPAAKKPAPARKPTPAKKATPKRPVPRHRTHPRAAPPSRPRR